VKVETAVPPQPLSLRETLIGAIERGEETLKVVDEADYGVGLESGFIEADYTITGYLNTQICVIIDRDGKMTIGVSSAFEFPSEVVEKVVKREVGESEEVMEKITGVERIGEKVRHKEKLIVGE